MILKLFFALRHWHQSYLMLLEIFNTKKWKMYKKPWMCWTKYIFLCFAPFVPQSLFLFAMHTTYSICVGLWPFGPYRAGWLMQRNGKLSLSLLFRIARLANFWESSVRNSGLRPFDRPTLYTYTCTAHRLLRLGLKSIFGSIGSIGKESKKFSTDPHGAIARSEVDSTKVDADILFRSILRVSSRGFTHSLLRQCFYTLKKGSSK